MASMARRLMIGVGHSKMKTRILIICILFISSALTILQGNCRANERRDEIIKIIDTYEQLNNAFLETVEKGDLEKHQIARKEVEEYGEKYYEPILPEIEKLVCEQTDVKLLQRFLELLIKTANSASEAPRWTLGNIYLCRPELTLNSIEKFKNNPILVNDLEFGFMNVTYQKESEIKNFESLNKKVQDLVRLKSK